MTSSGPRLADLKAEAQEHYKQKLAWTDSPEFGGSSWADVDHHTVSVMVDPPTGNPHIARVWNDRQEALVDVPEMEDMPTLATAFQLAFELGLEGDGFQAELRNSSSDRARRAGTPGGAAVQTS